MCEAYYHQWSLAYTGPERLMSTADGKKSGVLDRVNTNLSIDLKKNLYLNIAREWSINPSITVFSILFFIR